jgi:Holliday junction resolvase
VSSIPEHLKIREEIEREGISGLVEVLREEGIETVRSAGSYGFGRRWSEKPF